MLWLADAGAEGMEGVRIAKSDATDAGLGAFAARDFQTGELVCKVPGKVIISSGICSEGMSYEIALAEALLRERHLGSASFYAPYIQSLPEWEVLAEAHPLHWPPEMCIDELLAGSSHGRALAAEFLEDGLSRAQFLLESGAAATLEEAKWALVVIDSRAFTFQTGKPSKELALVPLLDVLNSFCVMEESEALWQCSFQPEGPTSDGGIMIAERPAKSGDELIHLYEENSSARLWMTYGFLPMSKGENPFEGSGFEITLASELASHDNDMKSKKMEALADAGFDVDKPRVFELPADGEVGGSLLPVARLLACGDMDEAQAYLDGGGLARADSVEAGGGLRNFGVQLEARARALVIKWLRDAVQKMDQATERLQEALQTTTAAPPQPGCTPERQLREMALELLRRERPVLELELSASQWFLDNLSQFGVFPWGVTEDCDLSSEELQEFVDENWDSETGWLGAG